MPFLIIEKLADYDERRMNESVAGILDASGLEFAGKNVLVKPNLLGPFSPDSAVVTHPALIRTVRRQLRERGCRVMIGDNPGIRGYGMVAKTARVSGAGEAAGDDFVNLTLRPRRFKIDSRFVESVSISSEILEVDILISLPKFKTHMGTVITGGVKNSYGFVVGADKTRLHAAAPRHEDFGELVADVYAIRPPDLVIMDAIIGMEGNGPSGGKPRRIGCLMASDNATAIDLAFCRMTGLDPMKVATQRTVMTRGLGPGSLEEVDISGEIPLLPRFRIPANLMRLDPWGIGHRLISRRLARPQIKVDKSKCVACGACAESCPVRAIEVVNYPSFDYNQCISCYCCYEICPENALRVGGLMRLLR
ncbi:MAG: hypothetical protein A2Y75_02600 [Candidatus Solincola sediminis]|uniref:4Fe-4S ferredoxin-type domain-containing protein n=1 Tax=Candidatus Solincola sediminis TaxID=1797199 RepID=A0A1F2WJN4_9ACTN|nr:MAG: hypothetical protein A2Y75_02600 [Candidatus Solincola sediminis]